MQFAGHWIGETQGCDSPAHLWHITQSGDVLFIDNAWEGAGQPGRMFGKLIAGEAAFMLGRFKAVLVDAQHFVVPGWDTNDARGNVGPNYDVVFSRPGIPELLADRVWSAWKEQHASA
jgi:hypothetical protein